MEAIQTELGQWEYKNCIIQKSVHPKLYGRYEIFENNSDEKHIERSYTIEGAKVIIDKYFKK